MNKNKFKKNFNLNKSLMFFLICFFLFYFDLAQAGKGGGPPSDVGGGPPSDVGGGPPSDVGGGPPSDVGDGPPSDVGDGPPSDVGDGPPSDVGNSNASQQANINQIDSPLESRSPFLIKANSTDFALIVVEVLQIDNISVGFINEQNIEKSYDINISYSANSVDLENNYTIVAGQDFSSLTDFDQASNFYNTTIKGRSDFEYPFTILHTDELNHFIIQPDTLEGVYFVHNQPKDLLKSFIYSRINQYEDITSMPLIESVYFLTTMTPDSDIEIKVEDISKN